MRLYNVASKSNSASSRIMVQGAILLAIFLFSYATAQDYAFATCDCDQADNCNKEDYNRSPIYIPVGISENDDLESTVGAGSQD